MNNLIDAGVFQYHRVKNLYLKYERLLMPATLVGGFLVDYFTFTSINISLTFILLVVYWLLAGSSILFIHLYDAEKLPLALRYVRLFAPLFLQFVFGSLLGPSLIFYWFSGAFSVSWPLMAIIALLMIFNETFREAFARPLIQIGVYFFITISLLSILLPYLFNSLSAWLFIVAGAVSLLMFFGFIYILGSIRKQTMWQQWPMWLAVLAIFLVINALYFANITPPIPLALREAGLYHSIQPQAEKYIMQGEPENLLQNIFGGQILHITLGSKVYLYTAIFAPAELQTTIVHHWQYYDETKKDWVDRGKLPFTINGGRKEGYKGYSYNSNLAAGKWRVFVENRRGQVLGKMNFMVEVVEEKVDLVEITR